MAVERRYKCWQCHRKQFRADELVAHKCSECRGEGAAAVAADPGLAKSAWFPEGQQHWVRFDGLGENAGVFFRPRKKKITKDAAKQRLSKLKELPTWKD